MGAPADVVLASCAALPAGDGDDDELLDALRAAGHHARWAPWDETSTLDADLVVLRATWDYPERLSEFLAWVQRVPRLANPAAAVCWSADKHYLLDLAADGVPVVPTAAFAPGQTVRVPDGEVVVKPAVGAGSQGAARFTDRAAALAHAAVLHAAGTAVLVQPFDPSVDTVGETAMVFVAGRPSHAFHKSAMLPPPGSSPVVDGSGRYLTERLRPVEPSVRNWRLAHQVVTAATSRLGLVPAELLYARVDVLGSAEPRLLELELVEPSLGWRQVGRAQRVAALASFVGAVGTLLAGTG